MSSTNRNHFLDVDESEDDVSQGYNSDDELQKGGRSAKRRKLRDEGSDDDDELSDVEDETPKGDVSKSQTSAVNEGARGAESGEEAPEDANDSAETSPAPRKEPKLPSLAKPVGRKNLVVTDAAIRKSGVIYLARLPPFIKPAKLRNLLEPYGQINRTFLSPEDPAARARRLRGGGNKKRMYTDGWVEFTDRRQAKQAVELLNARPIGGKKGSFYRDDVWSMRYLKSFKWHNLTEQIAAENAERESRMRAEIGKTAKETKEFVRNVERAKMLDGINAKATERKKRQRPEGEDQSANGGGSGGIAEDAAGDGVKGGRERKRTFDQRPLVKKRESASQPEHVTRVLSKIF